MMRFFGCIVLLLCFFRGEAFQAPQLGTKPTLRRIHTSTTSVVADGRRSSGEVPHHYDRSSHAVAPTTKTTSIGLFGRSRSQTENLGSENCDRRLRLHRLRKFIRRAMVALSLFFVVTLSSLSPAWAGSGGRMGGSFKRSSGGSSYSRPLRSAPSRSYSSPPMRSYHRPPPIIMYHSRPRVNVYSPGPILDMESSAAVSQSAVYSAPLRRQRGISASDIVLVTGAGTAIALGVRNHYKNGGGSGPRSALGPGVSLLSLTVALNVPNRDSPTSILSKLSRQAYFANTDSRRGLQSMLSETALELLRQERSIVSIESSYEHFSSDLAAERAFNSISISQRSKFDRETLSNVGGKKVTQPSSPEGESQSKATMAVVSLICCIEGDSTKFGTIRNRLQLKNALHRIASDSQVEDCLLGAEVLWTPEDSSDVLTVEDVYADYPSLYPLLN